MKTILLGLVALGASTVSAFPSTMRHGHLHSAKRQDWTGAQVGGYGLAYDLMADDGSCRSAGQISGEIGALVGEGYTLFRTYDVGCDVGALAAVLQQHPGVKLFAGINTLDVSGQLPKLIGMLSSYWSVVDTINIGNEMVNTGAASPDAVAGAVAAGRGLLNGAGYWGNVVTVDTFIAHMNNPGLSSTSDYVAANTHAFFDGSVAAEGAGDFVKRMQGVVAGKVGGKRVVVSESGWPHCGNSNGAAIPGYGQTAAAVGSLKSAFSADPTDLIVFQSYDAKYKQPGAGGVEQCWGTH